MIRVINIVGDIVLYCKMIKEYDRNFVVLLNRLFCKREIIFSFNNDKCKIGMSEIVFKGLILNKYDVGLMEEKVKGIGEIKVFINFVELCSFLGFVILILWWLWNYLGIWIIRVLSGSGEKRKMKYLGFWGIWFEWGIDDSFVL